jgi:tetratricopeptide (TPR) repeat protein
MARVYVSSTFKDLEECREKVRIALKQIGHEDIAMEYYVAEDKKPLGKCLEDVASCDLYIGIFAWRYGFVPKGYDKSITELEYRKALETRKECLLFLLKEDAPWPPMFVDRGKDSDKIMALRDELSNEKMVGFFYSGDSLVSGVEAAVIKWEKDRRVESTSTTTNSEIQSHYNPSTLPNYPDALKDFVTKNRAEELNNALTYLQNHRILLLTGMGGVGKTTIARALIDIKPDNVPMPFWFDFGQNKDARIGDILEKLASYLNTPDIARFREEKREPEKKDIDKLTDKIQAGVPVWLIFDNLESILDDIYFHDEYMDLFFTCLHNSTHLARIIITSRILPKLKNGEGLIGVNEGDKQGIKGLRTNFAIDYLVKNGLGDLEPDKLEKLAKGVDGHPLALQLLVGLVKDFGVEDILEDLSIYQEHMEDTILKARKLFDKLVGNEKELLERISVYREPVGMKGIREMFEEKSSLNSIKKLIDKSLLETDHKGNYWLHPLVQEFSYEDLKNKKEVHLIAFNYYKSLNLPENPTKKEDVQSLIEAHYHACMAKEYNKAFQIIFDNNLHEKLDLWGNYTVLVDLYTKMLPEDHFGNEIFLEKKGDHGMILGKLGIMYMNLSKHRKAIEYSEQALKISREEKNKCEEGANLRNLGIVFNSQGEPEKAKEYFEQALKISKERGDRQGEGNNFCDRGSAYYNLKKHKTAIYYYEKALGIAREIDDRRGEGKALGNLGNAYIDLRETKKAIGYYEQALNIAIEIRDRKGEGDRLGNLGNAYIDLGETKKAIEYCEQALEIAREIGDRRGEGNRLGNLGVVYRNLGEFNKAIDYYEQALKINPGDTYTLYNEACAYSLMYKKSEALAYLKRAVKLNPDFRKMAKSEKNFEKLWEDRDFLDLVTVNKEV